MSFLIIQMKESLYDMAYNDIVKAMESKKLPMGTFILASCLIDYLAGFRYGLEFDKKGYVKNSSKNYKDFIKEYLADKYDSESLYSDMRCRLVHNYSEGGSYRFTHNQPNVHNKVDNGKRYINLENFINDVKTAMDRYFQELKDNEKLQKIAQKRFDDLSILSVFKGNDVISNSSMLSKITAGSTVSEGSTASNFIKQGNREV